MAVLFTDADSLAELSIYDVVLHAGYYYDAMSGQYWAALRDYVEADAGGVVTTGLHSYSLAFSLGGQSRVDADFISPANTAGYSYDAGYASNTYGDIDGSHPITDGLGSSLSFVSGQYAYGAKGIDGDAVSLGFDVSQAGGTFYNGYAVAYTEADGLGNRVYVAGDYTRAFQSTYYGTGDWDQLLEQAVSWAAGGGGGADEDTPLTITGIAVSDVDADADDIAVTLSIGRGTLALNTTTGLNFTDSNGGDGTLSFTGSQAAINAALDDGLVYTPDANFNGTDNLTITVDDQGHNGSGGAQVTTASVDITVNPVNDAPVANDDGGYTTAEDTPVTIAASGLLSNDTDVDNDSLSIASVGNAVGGSVALDANGDVVFTPDADFNGAASFDYTVSDGNGGSDTATASVAVSAVNDAPVIEMSGTGSGTMSVAVVGYNTAGQIAAANQLNDDTHFDFTATLVTPDQVDTLAEVQQYDAVLIAGYYYQSYSTQMFQALGDYVDAGGGVVTTGWFTYTLNQVLSGSEQTAADYITPITTGGRSVQFSPTITINDPSHAIANGITSYTVQSAYVDGSRAVDASAVMLGTFAGDVGGIVYDDTGVGPGRTVYLGETYTETSYQSTAMRTGVEDQIFEQAVAWAAGGGGSHVVDEDGELTISGVSVSDVDAGSDPIAVTLSVGNGTLTLTSTAGLSATGGLDTGTLTFTGSQAAINGVLNGSLVYRPNPDFNGGDSLSVSVNDQGHNGTGGAQVTTASAMIEVRPVNDAPVVEGVGSAVFDSFDDGTLDTTLWTTTNTNSGGSIVESGGSLQITLREHLTSQDSFVPTASQPVTVSGEFSFGLLQDTFTVVTRSGGIPFASTGEIANGLLFAVQASNGTDTGFLALLELVNGVGSFQKVTPTFQIGVDTVYAFEVIDNGLDVSITLTDTADPANTVTLSATSTLDTGSNLVSVYNRGGDIGTPVVTLDEISIEQLTPPAGVVQVTEDTALSSAIVASDVDGDALSFTLTTDAGNGAVALAADGAFTYTPDADFFGTDSFTVDVFDGTATVSHTVNLNVSPVNDAPTVSNPSLTVAEGETVTISNTDLGVGDVDDADGDVDITVTNVTNGRFENRADSQNPVITTTFTLAAVVAGIIVFVHDGSDDAPSFSVTATDAAGASSATVDATITFTPDANTAPVANDDTIIAEGSFTLDSQWLLANDTDADGDTLSMTDVVGATIDGAGLVTASGSFTYKATDDGTAATADGDSTESSDPATVNVTFDTDGVIDASTSTDDLVLIGGANTTNITGGSGDDVLFAGDNDVTMIGGAGTDTLFGGTSNDVLRGGAGNDTLTGGGSNDTFRVSAGEGDDVITDFNVLDVLTFETFDLLDGDGNDVFGLSQGGGGVLISAGDVSVELTGLTFDDQTGLVSDLAGVDYNIILDDTINTNVEVTIDPAT